MVTFQPGAAITQSGRWLFACITRNYMIHLDYILIQRFKDKGYQYDHLLEVRDLVGNVNRDTILAMKIKKDDAYDVTFITGFNKQFENLEQSIKKYISCGTRYVTYVMECTCGYQYVGRTSRKLAVGVGEHITNIYNGFPKHIVSIHFRLAQNKDPTALSFYAIDTISRNWRKVNIIKQISQN